MKVLVKQDSATSTPVDCGEGEEGKARLANLVAEYGSAVTQEDGSPIPASALPAEPAVKKSKSKSKPKAKAKAKAKAKSKKRGR
jgi:hypothetical protein